MCGIERLLVICKSIDDANIVYKSLSGFVELHWYTFGWMCANPIISGDLIVVIYDINRGQLVKYMDSSRKHVRYNPQTDRVMSSTTYLRDPELHMVILGLETL